MGDLYSYYVLTANHVIDKVKDKQKIPIDILEFDQYGKELRSVRVFGPTVEQNEELDFSIIKIQTSKKLSYSLNSSLYDSKQIKIFDKVYKVGSPNGENLVVSEGVISGFSVKMPGYITTSVGIYHGDSGSGLFNERFELIGINLRISMGRNQRLPHIGYSMPLYKIYESLGEKVKEYF
jgi:S1-C subfamily serine protease